MFTWSRPCLPPLPDTEVGGVLLRWRFRYWTYPTNATTATMTTANEIPIFYSYVIEKTTMIIATHEMKFAKHIADKVIFIDNGEIIEEGSAEEIFNNIKSERLKQFLNKFQVK